MPIRPARTFAQGLGPGTPPMVDGATVFPTTDIVASGPKPPVRSGGGGGGIPWAGVVTELAGKFMDTGKIDAGDVAGAVAGKVVGAKVGAVVGTAIGGPVGTIVGSVVGTAIGGLVSKQVDKTIDSSMAGAVPKNPYGKAWAPHDRPRGESKGRAQTAPPASPILPAPSPEPHFVAMAGAAQQWRELRKPFAERVGQVLGGNALGDTPRISPDIPPAGFTIEGNAKFKRSVIKSLNAIYKTPQGKEMCDIINQKGRITIHEHKGGNFTKLSASASSEPIGTGEEATSPPENSPAQAPTPPEGLLVVREFNLQSIPGFDAAKNGDIWFNAERRDGPFDFGDGGRFGLAHELSHSVDILTGIEDGVDTAEELWTPPDHGQTITVYPLRIQQANVIYNGVYTDRDVYSADEQSKVLKTVPKLPIAELRAMYRENTVRRQSKAPLREYYAYAPQPIITPIGAIDPSAPREDHPYATEYDTNKGTKEKVYQSTPRDFRPNIGGIRIGFMTTISQSSPTYIRVVDEKGNPVEPIN